MYTVLSVIQNRITRDKLHKIHNSDQSLHRFVLITCHTPEVKGAIVVYVVIRLHFFFQIQEPKEKDKPKGV